ncbi:hypothetical protein CLOM_g1050 [Closterium sp. NIES-68]|nr:hypothetical protein CLOM_g1050 [Closterium sp. NIES-68]
MALHSIHSTATYVLGGRDRVVTLLLMRLAEWLMMGLMVYSTFWDELENAEYALGPTGLQQLVFDMYFVMQVAKAGKYSSRAMRKVAEDSATKAIVLFTDQTGGDPNSLLQEDWWYEHKCLEAIEELAAAASPAASPSDSPSRHRRSFSQEDHDDPLPLPPPLLLTLVLLVVLLVLVVLVQWLLLLCLLRSNRCCRTISRWTGVCPSSSRGRRGGAWGMRREDRQQKHSMMHLMTMVVVGVGVQGQERGVAPAGAVLVRGWEGGRGAEGIRVMTTQAVAAGTSIRLETGTMGGIMGGIGIVGGQQRVWEGPRECCGGLGLWEG